MILAAVLIENDREQELVDMGCKDSKLVPLTEMDGLNNKVKSSAVDTGVVEVSAKEIDSMRKRISLNEIELQAFGRLVSSFNQAPDKIVIDCPDVNLKRFEKRFRNLVGDKPELVIEHEADLNHPVVSAASIVAKSLREKRVAELAEKHGFFGSGYPHDEKARKFLKEYLEKNDKWPYFVRKSWSTAEELLDEKLQSGLNDF